MPDYFLILPLNTPIYGKGNDSKLGIVRCSWVEEDKGILSKFFVVRKEFFEDFMGEQERATQKKADIDIDEK